MGGSESLPRKWKMGTFHSFWKENAKIPLKGKGEKYTAEDLQDISFDEVKMDNSSGRNCF